MSDDSVFARLNPALQKWTFRKGWQDLLPIQKAAFDPILKCDRDIIISASTASGKTEAAFLPALSAVTGKNAKKGVRILYVSPLKALINDQYRRLATMTQDLDIRVTPWHGDISAEKKEKLLRDPDGIILTTPESLESMLINHVSWIREAMANLKYIVIDEFHAFMGSQRGYQLQSQLHRIDNLCGRVIVRIALSATFSDSSGVSSYLRPGGSLPCRIITDDGKRGDQLAVQVRGYDIADPFGDDDEAAATLSQDYDRMLEDLFKLMRSSTNLVFCNSRSFTERIATSLQRLSEQRFVPNEFFPHHGSLSREFRETLESRLIEGRLPTTAICTATLELGIDISDVHSIAQIEPPTSVASLRQRLGRSGRRDHLAVLRLFIPECRTLAGAAANGLYENTFLSVAMVQLLLKHWYEPPLEHEYAFSTLLQQTLSVIASFGSVSARQLHLLLCKTGPFNLCTPAVFAKFLRSLGAHDLITQLNDGTLTLGLEGESLVSNWNFYSAFKSPDEYAIEYDSRRIGTAPLNQPLSIDDTFLFAGRGWKVVYFSQERKLIGVKPYPHHTQPLLLSGSAGHIHDRVRQEMLALYEGEEVPQFLNRVAQEHFRAGLENFRRYGLDKRHVISAPSGFEIFPWAGDRVLRTMILMLKRKNIKAVQIASHIVLGFTSMDSLKTAVKEILAEDIQDATELASKISNLDVDKHDQYISDELKRLGFAWSALDLEGAMAIFRTIAEEL